MPTPPADDDARPWGGGMMGHLIRRFDWYATSLGPLDQWPDCLMAVVDLVLGSPLPMIVLWGEDLVQIYNDGYARVAAAKHPGALGQLNRACWPEVWAFNAPIYEAVWRGESRTFTGQKLTIERHGVPEDAWFDLTFSPVRDGSGAVAGILVTVVENTLEVRARQIEERAEARLTAVLESTTDCVLVLDRDWTIVYENQRAIDLVNEGRVLIGRNLWDAFPDARGTRFWDEYHRAMHDQQPADFTAYLPSLGRWFEVVAYPSPEQLSLFFRDATPARRQAEALRQTQERLRLALDAGGVATWMWDVQRDIVHGDTFFATLCDAGREAAEEGLPLADVLEIVHPEDRRRVRAGVRRAIETGWDFEAEFRVGDRDRGVRWFLARGRCLRDAAGVPAAFPGALVDVTEKRAAQAALEASETRLRSVLDQMPVGVALAEMPSGELLYHNARAVELLRHPLLPSADYTGYARYGAIHPDKRPYAPEEYPMARTVLTGEKVNREEMLYRRGDGTMTHFEVSNSLIQDADGRPVLGISTFDDISERKQTEERQRLLMREVDHRAKNVLSVVQAVMQLTRADTMEGFVRAVSGRVQALARAHALLARNRWSGASVLSLVKEELAPYDAEEAVHLHLDGADVRVTADTAQPLGMVLHELATNAAKYGALSVPGGRLDIAWRLTEGGELCLSWRETGGPHVTPPSRRGFGSELIKNSVSYQLCGEAVLDWPPEGLHCRLRIGRDCLLDQPPAAGGTAPAAEAPAFEPARLQGLRVLVVEDDAMLGLSVKQALEAEGCVVVGPAATVEQALRMAAAEDLGAAVLDLNLMGRTTLPVADVLDARRIPHLFATGYGGEDMGPRTAPVLEKPFTMDRLLAALRRTAAGDGAP